MNLILPEISKYNAFPQLSERFSCITNLYGLPLVMKNYLGLKNIQYLRSLKWTHGWAPVFPGATPEHLLAEPLSDVNGWLLVTPTDNHRSVCRSYSVETLSIGTPFCYVERKEIPLPRRKSVLVMPSHSTRWGKPTFGEGYSEFLDTIQRAKCLGYEVVICLHEEDIKYQDISLWKALGFPIVQGASVDDLNALYRIHLLLSQFEIMLTDCLGSHVFYAGLLGARVSLFKPKEGSYCYQDNDPAIKEREKRYTAEKLATASFSRNKEYSRLCREIFGDASPRMNIDDAVSLVDIAKSQLGFYNVLPPKELRDLFIERGVVELNAAQPKGFYL